MKGTTMPPIPIRGFGGLLLLGVLTSGCGDTECGQGTTLVDGQCVSASRVECGDGTELVGGKCVPIESSDVECGEGTTLVDGKCVPTSEDVECGEGTTLVDGTCVPTGGDVECGEGTKLVDGKCVPLGDGVECGAGMEIVDGRCLVRCAEDEERVDEVCRLACDPQGIPFGGGDGSWSSPYRICAVEQLLAVRNHLDKDFVLTTDLDLTGIDDFAPLGGPDPGDGLRARFDGGGRELRGLRIQRPGENGIGLFGRIEPAGSVRALGLVDIEITGAEVVGALAGWAEGNVENCYATGEVTGTSHVGGLVGNTKGRVVGSYARVTVQGNSDVGGLAGGATGEVLHAHALGSVQGHTRVGGLVGEAGGRIENAYARGSVTGVAEIGGLVGQGLARIARSFATGAVDGDDHVGGLVGQNFGDVDTSYATGRVEGFDRVGGLVGENGGTVIGSYAIGTVTAIQDSGGLVGYSEGGTGLVVSSFFLDPEDGSPSAPWGNRLARGAFAEPGSFGSWDFANTWRIQSFEDPDFARPVLRTNPEK